MSAELPAFAAPAPHPLLVVMGVSGSGKSTVGAAIAQRLRVPFADADDFHPPANIAKMTARVMQEVGDRKPAPTFSSLFALDFAFGRRVAFACLLTLAVLGSYLVTRETGEPAALSPEMIMASQDAPASDAGQAHEAMLATLTRYEP